MKKREMYLRLRDENDVLLYVVDEDAQSVCGFNLLMFSHNESDRVVMEKICGISRDGGFSLTTYPGHELNLIMGDKK
jgi:hypothetical protein